ncbi:MAG TPA: transporter substrate-binding domain-containing protein [Burkholderiales bacterium]|nr:transporter substrate-binding domain-containing protein [Burkholderiales bacterium]
MPGRRLVSLLLSLPLAAFAQNSPEPAALALDVLTAPALRDFDAMREARLIRALLPHSRTLFYSDRGRQRGISADSVREFERWINRKYRRSLGARPLTVALIPTPREKLIEHLVEGRGDIAVANLTITASRQAHVDFSVPQLENVSEIVVAGPASPRLAVLEDLAGKEVHVRKASSYYESLTALNARFQRADLAPMRIRIVPDALEDEDLMEMLSAGLLGIIVVDDWKAKLWARILPKIRPLPHIALRSGAETAWAFRRDSPLLAAEVNAFLSSRKHTGRLTEWELLDTHRRIRRIENSTRSSEWRKFEATIDLFRKYGERYRVDYLMVAAQAYRESRLDQDARSPAGAIGIMQLLPETGRAMGVGDIHRAEANIHAGVKYLRILMDRHFNDPGLDEQNRTLFAVAAYNAGPTRIARLRSRAGKQGLDADAWFDNVEIAAGRFIGREPVRYVRDVLKYYAAYRLQLEARAERDAAREALEADARR